MNIVIANAPGILDTGQEVIPFPSRWDSGIPNNGKKPFAFFPYQLAYLSALLKRELPEANITLLDGNLESWNGDTYIEEIAKLQPDWLICELSALTYPTMTRVMQGVEDWYPAHTMRAILCGPATAIERADLDGWTDIVVGEYELQALSRLGGTVPDEARVNGLVNLDWLPWPEDEDVDRTRYYEVNHYAPPAMIQLYATRGCPLSCTFCVVPTYYGGHGKSHKSHRCRNVEDVCDEIEYLAAKYPTFKGCYFNEEAHNANAEWFVSFCEALICRGLNRYQFDAMCGYWNFTEEMVQLASRAGYKQIRFGVESTSQQVGKSIGKTIHLEKMERFLGWCKQYGIKTYGTVQIGAPGSTEATDRQTIEDVRRWYALELMQKHQVSTSTPQPSTPMYEEAKRNGWLTTMDIGLYDGVNAVMDRPAYPAERVRAVRAMA